MLYFLTVLELYHSKREQKLNDIVQKHINILRVIILHTKLYDKNKTIDENIDEWVENNKSTLFKYVDEV